MERLLEWLSGKKTYFCALAVALIALARQLNWIDDNAYATLLTLLGAGGLTALRAGMKK